MLHGRRRKTAKKTKQEKGKKEVKWEKNKKTQSASSEPNGYIRCADTHLAQHLSTTEYLFCE